MEPNFVDSTSIKSKNPFSKYPLIAGKLKLRPSDQVLGPQALDYFTFDQPGFSICGTGRLFPYCLQDGLRGVPGHPGHFERVVFEQIDSRYVPFDAGNYLGWGDKFHSENSPSVLPELINKNDFILYAGPINFSIGHFILEMLPRLYEAYVLLSQNPSLNKTAYVNPLVRDHVKAIDNMTSPDNSYRYYLDKVCPGIAFKAPDPCVEFNKALITHTQTSLTRLGTKFSNQCVLAWQSIASQSIAGEESIPFYSKVYITRRHHTKPFLGREIANEKEVEEVFESFGFHILSVERLMKQHGRYKAESIKHTIIKRANYIAGAVGSNLSSMVFAKPRTKILAMTNMYLVSEVFNASLTHTLYVTDLLDHKLFLFADVDSITQSWVVDISRLGKFIEDSLKTQ